jgi:hypothetical protein
MAMGATTADVLDKSLEKRIESMFRADRAWATGAVVALWITVFFVMFAIRGLMNDPAIEIACWSGAGLLLLFNTASIVAMIRHYGQDKAHIYGVDILHLDAGR